MRPEEEQLMIVTSALKKSLDNFASLNSSYIALKAKLSESEQRVKELEKFEQQMKTLRALCGHIEDGSNDSVTLSQDDATGTWHITVGYSPRSRKSFWDESFDGVFLKAKSYVEEMQEFV